MGASTWVYFTPYHPKPSAALRCLREHVFAAGQYRKPATVQERLARLGPLPLPSQLEASELAFAEELHCQAVYFAVYQGGAPVEWAFVGSSGD